jgi:hypothetical protein
MKIVEMGVEVLDSDKNLEKYNLEVYNEEVFRKNFIFYYKMIAEKNYLQLTSDLKGKGMKNTDDFIINSFLSSKEKTLSKISLNIILKATRKDKIKRLKL